MEPRKKNGVSGIWRGSWAVQIEYANDDEKFAEQRERVPTARKQTHYERRITPMVERVFDNSNFRRNIYKSVEFAK